MNAQQWRPSASIALLKKRAALIKVIRQFFDSLGYWEVETPAMGRHAVTDVYLSNIEATFRDQIFYLQTSPEYHMKRLLAAGSGPVFQLARVFRDDELGRWHNPEFTLLEWYQLSINHHGLMQEVDLLLQTVLNCGPMVKKTYQEVFIEYCGFDPLQASCDELKQLLESYHLNEVLEQNEQDLDQYLFLLMSHVIEPSLAKIKAPVAVYDFPVSQAALARVNQGVAERFEVYYQGVELANGFHELTDMDSQAKRFQEDNRIRKHKGLAEKQVDDCFLQALAHGLPNCSGVALGLDRLMALALGQNSIAEIMAFDVSRA